MCACVSILPFRIPQAVAAVASEETDASKSDPWEDGDDYVEGIQINTARAPLAAEDVEEDGKFGSQIVRFATQIGNGGPGRLLEKVCPHGGLLLCVVMCAF